MLLQISKLHDSKYSPYIYRLLYSWLYNTEIYLDKCPDDFTILDHIRPERQVQYGKVIGHESKYISVLYSQLYNYLFIIYPTV